MKLRWDERRVSWSRELSTLLAGIGENDIGEVVYLGRHISTHSELGWAKMKSFSFPLLLLGRELWRSSGAVDGQRVESDEWYDFTSEIAMSIALGAGIRQNLPLAYEMLLDGFTKVEQPGCFPHHFIEIGATADVVRDRLPEAKLAQLQDEEECWLEDDGMPGENPAIPFGWWMDKRPVERIAVDLALNDHGEVNGVLKNVGGSEFFLDWSSLRQEFAFYGGDNEFHYFPQEWVEAIAKDDVGKVLRIGIDPAFGKKGIISLFWCGARDSLVALIERGKVDIPPSELAAFAVRNFPDDLCVVRAVERRWPGTLVSYRDDHGRTFLQKMDAELIFGGWRMFFGDMATRMPIRNFLRDLM